MLRLEIMKLMIEVKIWCVPEYRRELLAAKQVITEAMPDDSYWSCGLSKEQVILTDRVH